jgi:hypothetical protein
MRRAILETQRYEHIKFSIDSVSPVQTGGTLRGTFHGVLTLAGTAPSVRRTGQGEAGASKAIREFPTARADVTVRAVALAPPDA